MGVAARVAAAIVLTATVSACSALNFVNGLVPSDTYTARTDLEYGPDPREKLDVYRPIQPSDPQVAGEGYPVVVFFHGGRWTSGERKDYKFIGEALASRGVLTIIAGYRLYPQVRYPDFLTDCARAVAWAKREAPRYGGDSRRLFLMGHSSGAYNAAMLALDPRWLSAVGLAPSALAGWIGLAGPYDFLPMTDVQAQPVFNHPAYPAGSQPIDYVARAAPRTFLGAAATDDLVDPERNTKQLAENLHAAGVPVTLRIYESLSHSTLIGAFARPLRGLEPVLSDVVGFIRGSPAVREETAAYNPVVRKAKKDRTMAGLTRRQMLLRVAPLGIAGIAFARAVRAADACVGPESESLRASLNYAGTGTDAGATCAHCAFFTADPAGACGACQILGGAVDSTGHCDSFSPPS